MDDKRCKKNKTALITGASRGIGSACARAFAAAGYDLYLTCLHTYDRLLSLKEELEAAFPVSCRIFVCDAGDYPSVCRLFSHIDTLDALVNNAGISYVGLIQDMPPSDWDRVLSVNLSSCFYTVKCAVPLMLKKKQGRIVNVSSVWGSAGASTESAYSASKGGVNAFTRALAKELAPSNIQVNAAAFGLIDTEMNHCFSKDELEILKEEIPAGRMGSCEEAAALILQLAQAPSYLTGQILTMDGGWI